MGIAIQKDCDRIPVVDILGFIDTIPQRIAAPIAANGAILHGRFVIMFFVHFLPYNL